MKVPKVTEITQMKTGRILLYVAYRHRVGLLITGLIVSWTYFIVTRVPQALSVLR